jgi:hypothetical protein
MAISVSSITQVTNELGFTRWTWIPFLHSTALETLRSIAYAKVPSNLVPADEFQVSAETTTCTLIAPWGGFSDPFTTFVRGGGGTGTLIGAVSGLGLVSQSFNQKNTATYGLGLDYLGPQFGYCVGTLLKEKVYSEVDAINVLNFNLIISGTTDRENRTGESKEQLIWRSKYERFYLNHGEIKSFETVSESKKQYKLSIYTKTSSTAVGTVDFSGVNDTITLYDANNGGSVQFDVTQVEGVGDDIVVDVTFSGDEDTAIAFNTGDFFVLSTPWIIQDPYILDGLMSSISNETIPSGSQEVFRTDQNQIISTGSFTGTYIRQEIVRSNSDDVFVTDEGDVVPIVDIEHVVNMPSPNVDISADASFKWLFYPITSGSDESEIWADDNRYVVTQFTNVNGETEYAENLTYIKVELSRGGRSTRTNFHDPALLDDAFVIQNNNYFKIIGQEGGHIIDVEIQDITKTVNFDPAAEANYIVYNQFAWKPIEWYMSDTRTRFLQGPVLSIDGSTIRVSINSTETSRTNTATTYGQSYFNQGARESISFFNRFLQTYDHDINDNPRKLYTKFKGWHQFKLTGGSFAISNITIPDGVFGDEPFVATIELLEEPAPEDIAVGDTMYSSFDSEEFSRRGAFNGAHLIDVEELPATPGGVDTNTFLCLDGFWLSPRFNLTVPNGTQMGLCGGRYWGLGDRAPDNDNAIVFMRSPAGVLGLASLFHSVTDEDWTLFYDVTYRKLCIRRASIEFSDLPEKYEVSIGLPSSSSPASVISSGDFSYIPLDTGQDRTKIMTMDLPDGDRVMLVYVNSLDDYYGTIISGDGDMNLLGLKLSGIEEVPELFKNDGNPVSPIYEYMFGKYSANKRRDIKLSVKTSDGPIIVDNGDNGISNVVVHYVNENQTIDNAILFDLLEISDGEIMITMGRTFPEFIVENPDDAVTLNSNSASSNTRWQGSSNGVFIIGSKDTGDFWGNPVKNRLNFVGDDQYGLLVMNDVNYCCSAYNRLSDEIILFVLAFSGNEVYFAALIVDATELNYKNFKCTPSNDAQTFLWRPPALSDQSFTATPVEDNYTFDTEENDFEDVFVKIASENPNVNADVTLNNVSDFGIVSANILSDGTIVVFYDSFDGIKILWSNTSGRSWLGSDIILARNAQGAVYSGDLLIYIVDAGLESKVVTEPLLNAAMIAGAGSSPEIIESTQSEFDSLIRTSLNTGPVPIQKLAGHEDNTGIYHVIYYDDDKRLCSAQGTEVDWKTTDNF